MEGGGILMDGINAISTKIRIPVGMHNHIRKDILEAFAPPCKTWPARMPAYCFTVLCPDARYRPVAQDKGDGFSGG